MLFQVSKRRRFPEGSRAAERSKINVHVFSSSGGLRRGLRESLLAGRLQSRTQRIFLKADSLHTPPCHFPPSCFQIKLFKFEII